MSKKFRIYQVVFFLFAVVVIFSLHVYGSDISKTASNPSVAERTLYVIAGRVTDTTADLSIEGILEFAHKAFDLYSIRNDDGKEFLKNYTAFLDPRTNRIDVVVTLEGNSIWRESRTGQDGKYRFENLPAGEYEITAIAPAIYCSDGEQREAKGHAIALIPSRSNVDININAYPVNIKGRILTSDGQPIAGAKVTGIPFALRISDDITAGYKEVDNPISALSDEVGVYELQGFMPMPVYELAGHLRTRYLTRHIEVRAEAAGYIQSANRVPKIPPVPPELIPPARRLMYFFLLYSGKEIYKPIQERDDLPAGNGNTITGVDIVMDRLDAASPPSSELPPVETN